jgi:hypothetical protein
MYCQREDCENRNNVVGGACAEIIYVDLGSDLYLTKAKAGWSSDRERAEKAERERDKAQAEVEVLKAIYEAEKAWREAAYNNAGLAELHTITLRVKDAVDTANSFYATRESEANKSA